ncbi:hypothetical protein CAPTEDRAFT_196473 [Capitella teleta]|uniref:Retrotransposon gag domain-containing protein n=1 Tax=Capitella teleta TaxID=283909 RepID=R7V9S1_CAPTE|nr:hypothetical protein CAPTEDRAFT_196473 [Capitella teleta]|eukprot:ELU13091.1 hypothetical protein CAPTEDRAFT_196473 [Capitella teleta]
MDQEAALRTQAEIAARNERRQIILNEINKVTKCDGSDPTLVCQWIQEIQLARGLPDNAAAIELISGSTCGAFKLELEAFLAQQPNRDAVLWEDIRTHLLQCFVSANHAEFHRGLLTKVRQQPGENILAYNRRFRQAALEAFPGDRNADQNRELVRIYGKGLLEAAAARKLVTAGWPATLEEAFNRMSARKTAQERYRHLGRHEEAMEVAAYSSPPATTPRQPQEQPQQKKSEVDAVEAAMNSAVTVVKGSAISPGTVLHVVGKDVVDKRRMLDKRRMVDKRHSTHAFRLSQKTRWIPGPHGKAPPDNLDSSKCKNPTVLTVTGEPVKIIGITHLCFDEFPELKLPFAIVRNMETPVIVGMDLLQKGFFPHYLLFGKRQRAQLTKLLSDHCPLFGTRLDNLRTALRVARENTRVVRERNKNRIDQQARERNVSVGDHVTLLANPPLTLSSKREPMFIVTHVQGPVITCQHQQTGKVKVVNKDKVKVCDPDVAWEGINPRPTRYNLSRSQPLPVAENELMEVENSDTPNIPEEADFVGQVGKALFGLATEEDLTQVQTGMQQIADQTDILISDHNKLVAIVNRVGAEQISQLNKVNELVNRTNVLHTQITAVNTYVSEIVQNISIAWTHMKFVLTLSI